MSKHILFLSGFFPDEIRSEIIRNSKSSIQFAADALQRSILKGLGCYYNNLRVVNLPFASPFPTHSKLATIKTFQIAQDNFNGTNVGYFNIIGYKDHDIYSKTRQYLSAWAQSTGGDKVVIIYSAYLPFLNAAISVKNAHKELKLCLILPDLPQFMNKSRSVIGNFVIDQNRKKLEKAFHAVDYYVLLTEYMAQKLPVEGKRWTVMEGIFNQEDTTSFDKEDKRNKKTILYTGTLAKRYGILTLLNAFSLIKDKDCELVICGEGDAETEIIKASNNDKRILFKGTVDRPIVLQMQRNASLLINPRSPEGEFTKFSFPSKTMEYLASGTPTLLFKLPGIPKEYYNYCFTPNAYSAESLAQKVTEILNLNSQQLAEIGSKAREFILNNKGPKTQCKKIFDLIESN